MCWNKRYRKKVVIEKRFSIIFNTCLLSKKSVSLNKKSQNKNFWQFRKLELALYTSLKKTSRFLILSKNSFRKKHSESLFRTIITHKLYLNAKDHQCMSLAEISYIFILFEEHKNKSQSLLGIKSKTGVNTRSNLIVQVSQTFWKKNFNVRTKTLEWCKFAQHSQVVLTKNINKLGFLKQTIEKKLLSKKGLVLSSTRVCYQKNL